jgi:hypothetical protein
MFSPRLCRLSAVILMTTGMAAGMGFAPIASVFAQRSPVKFTMPRITYDRGAPGKRGEGASRGNFCSAANGPIALTPQYSEPRLGANGKPLLNPDASPQEQYFVLAQTSEARPTFALHLPLGQQDVADLTLNLFVMDAAGNQVYDLPIPAPKQAGIITFKPDNNQAELQKGQRYSWAIEIAVACTASQLGTPKYKTLEGQIERQSLRQSPAVVMGTAEYAIAAAEQGFWPDAMATVADLRRQDPSNGQSLADWSALLKSINLESLATAPLSKATQLLKPLSQSGELQSSHLQPSPSESPTPGRRLNQDSRLYPVR